MKKSYLLPVAAIFAAACTESTAPSSSADLTPSYAKRTPTATADSTFSTTTVRDFYTFSSNGIAATGGSFFSVEDESNPGITSSPATTISPSGEEFLGRFENTRTQAILNVPNSGAQYYLDFNLYAIGSLDGKGKQAQHGAFLPNYYNVDLVCSNGATTTIFRSDFSNQKTVQQDYPANLALGQTGGNKAGTGSYAQDLLMYKSAPTISNTPQFQSYGDTEYRIVLGGFNPCPVGSTIKFVFSSDLRQSNYDESFGIDNVLIKTGT